MSVAIISITMQLSLEIDSPSRGRKHSGLIVVLIGIGLEIDSPSRGRKRSSGILRSHISTWSLEIDSPSRGRKHE